MVEFSPYAYEVHEDPYPIYKELRAHAPVYRNDQIGFFALSRHVDVLAAFKQPLLFSNEGGVSLEQGDGKLDPSVVMSFLGMDPPRHGRMRSLVSRAFTPRRVNDLEPRIRELARHYLDALPDDGRCDFIDDFAGRLPMDVVSEMLGVPVSDRGELRTWADQVLHRDEGVPDIPPEAIAASGRLLAYFAELVRDRRKHLGSDLASGLIEAELDGECLADPDIIGFLFLMIIAGNETTTKLLGNMLYWAQRNPGVWDAVRADVALVPLWAEETLRYDNSTQALARTLTEDTEIRGVKLPAGEKVLLLVGSANRDEEVFPNADVYDLQRDTSSGLHFGKGTHFCLGASLARLEARVSMEELRARVSGYEIDESGLERVHSSNVRGFAKVPLSFRRA